MFRLFVVSHDYNVAPNTSELPTEAIGDIFKGVGSELANAMKGLGEVFQQSEQQSVGDKEKHKAMEKRLERLEKELKEQANLATQRAERRKKALALILEKLQ